MPKWSQPAQRNSDRAGTAAGWHVGRLGAGAVGNRDLADCIPGVLGFQERGRLAPDPVAVPVEAEGGGQAKAVYTLPMGQRRRQRTSCHFFFGFTRRDTMRTVALATFPPAVTWMIAVPAPLAGAV